MSDLVGNPEDRFSHNEAQLLRSHGRRLLIESAMIKCEDDNNLSSKIDRRLDQASIIELRSSVHRCFTNCYVERERNYRYVNENECHVNNNICYL